jgi:hypothetical protein
VEGLDHKLSELQHTKNQKGKASLAEILFQKLFGKRRDKKKIFLFLFFYKIL